MSSSTSFCTLWLLIACHSRVTPINFGTNDFGTDGHVRRYSS